MTVTDLLGLVVSSTDAWGTVTATTYEPLNGRVQKTSTNRPGQAAVDQSFTYDDDSKLETVTGPGGESLATVNYNEDTQELESVTYGVSGVALSAVARDAAGRTIGHTWTVGGETITDVVARSQSGRIVQHATTRGATAYTSTYGYDGAGRLTSASIPGHELTYGFGAAAGCVNSSAGKSGNRTSLTDVYTAPGQAAVTSSTSSCAGAERNQMDPKWHERVSFVREQGTLREILVAHALHEGIPRLPRLPHQSRDYEASDMSDEPDWWADGRMAIIGAGPYAGRLIFMAPDTVEPWWIFVINPPPIDGVPGDNYADEADLPLRLSVQWKLRWIDRSDDEAELERSRFGWRPLRGTSWCPAPPPQTVD